MGNVLCEDLTFHRSYSGRGQAWVGAILRNDEFTEDHRNCFKTIKGTCGIYFLICIRPSVVWKRSHRKVYIKNVFPEDLRDDTASETVSLKAVTVGNDEKFSKMLCFCRDGGPKSVSFSISNYPALLNMRLNLSVCLF